MYQFAYHRPESVEDACQILADDEDARVVAGGQSLLPMMKQRLVQPSALVDIRRMAGLDAIDERDGRLHVGAMARHYDVSVSDAVAAYAPVLNQLAGGIGDVQVRHRGTIGGSVSNNDPAADYPAACLALDAVIVTSRRRIDAANFFLGMFETALEQGEIVTGVEFTRPEKAAYVKFRHPISRYALVGVFVAVLPSGVRVAVTGASSCALRLSSFEDALTETLAASALENAGIDEDMLSGDMHASVAYRAHMIRHITRDAISRLA